MSEVLLDKVAPVEAESMDPSFLLACMVGANRNDGKSFAVGLFVRDEHPVDLLDKEYTVKKSDFGAPKDKSLNKHD